MYGISSIVLVVYIRRKYFQFYVGTWINTICVGRVKRSQNGDISYYNIAARKKKDRLPINDLNPAAFSTKFQRRA